KNQQLTIRGTKYTPSFSLFGSCASGDLNRVRRQHRRDMLIAVGFALILRRDNPADFLFDAFASDVFAVAAAQTTLKEKLELEEALRRMDVFIGRGSAHGRFVHIDIFGDIAQHHRPQAADTVVEKFQLKLEDALGHTE